MGLAAAGQSVYHYFPELGPGFIRIHFSGARQPDWFSAKWRSVFVVSIKNHTRSYIAGSIYFNNHFCFPDRETSLEPRNRIYFPGFGRVFYL